MKVISTSKGIILYFPTKEVLQGVIKHLQGQLEWIEKTDSIPPYLYCVYDDRIPNDEVDEMLTMMKVGII